MLYCTKTRTACPSSPSKRSIPTVSLDRKKKNCDPLQPAVNQLSPVLLCCYMDELTKQDKLRHSRSVLFHRREIVNPSRSKPFRAKRHKIHERPLNRQNRPSLKLGISSNPRNVVIAAYIPSKVGDFYSLDQQPAGLGNLDCSDIYLQQQRIYSLPPDPGRVF